MQSGYVSSLEEAYAYSEVPMNVCFLMIGWSHKQNWLHKYAMQIPHLHLLSRVLSVAFIFTLPLCSSTSWTHLMTLWCWSWVIRISYGLNWKISLQAPVLNACSFLSSGAISRGCGIIRRWRMAGGQPSLGWALVVWSRLWMIPLALWRTSAMMWRTSFRWFHYELCPTFSWWWTETSEAMSQNKWFFH